MTDDYEGWAIVELMGHRRLAGVITPVEMYGTKLLRLDVPDDDAEGGIPFTTHFYSPGSLYCLTPTSEDTARQVAGLARPAPVARWELPERVPDREVDDVFEEAEPGA